MSNITSQPGAHPSLSRDPHATHEAEFEAEGYGDGRAKIPTVAQIKRKLTTKEGWLGSYDFGFLCMPQLPFSVGRGTKKTKPTPFYALEEEMPITLAFICGFQHALAMLAGLITPPIIFANQLGFTPAQQTQMVAVSLIASGFLSAIQMTRMPIPFTKRKYWMGSGLITVVGTSFATLSTASAIFSALYADGTCPSSVVDGVTVRGACPDAYGYLLGTSCLCSIFEMALSFVPPKVLKRVFPPIVTGTVIILIGASLVGESGFLNWGGGSGNCHTRPDTGFFALCPDITATRAYKWGDARFIGLGFLSWVTILFVEFFGSPAMKSASIIIGLVVGCIVAGPLGYIEGASITSAPAATFLWRETFPLRVHGPSILPMICVYISLAMEATGDITASSEVSRQPVEGKLFDSRVQGGILADGVNGCISGLMMNPPVSIFAQNNGVIAITRCANRTAGYWCAFLLVLFGVLSKISGVFVSIPAPVLGGVTTFLFASVAVSGLKVLSLAKFTRRDRMVLAAALSFGLGGLLVDDWSSYIFTYDGSNSALKGFFNAIVIVLSTPFLIAGIVASLLNAILPAEPVDAPSPHDDDSEMDRVEAAATKPVKRSESSVDDDIKEA